jgi:nicotinamide riboside transporter PnuC
MDFLNFLGMIAFILTMAAMYLIGKPSIHCFIFFVVAQVIQIYIFYVTKQWFLILQMLMLVAFNGINYVRWKKQGVGI